MFIIFFGIFFFKCCVFMNFVSFIVNSLVFDFFNWFLFLIVIFENFLNFCCVFLFLICEGSFVIRF